MTRNPSTQAAAEAAAGAPSGAPSIPATMRAWCQHRYGGPETQQLETVAVPTPRKGQVLVRVRATALNAGDTHIMHGRPGLVRLAFGMRRPRPAVRGIDVAGTVVAIGEGVTGFAIGDEVVGEFPGGGLGEYALARASSLTARPANLAPEAAAALPVAGGTAWLALEHAGLEAGRDPAAQATPRVLVIGASGGVGTYAVQLAAHRGADVWALAGARNLELVAGLGASRVFDYREVQPGAPELPEGAFDAVVDVAGTAPLPALQRLVRDGGTVVLVGGDASGLLGPVGRNLEAVRRSIGSKRPIRSFVAMTTAQISGSLVALAAAGSITPVVERVWSFDEAGDAIAHVDAGHTVGKAVVRVSEPASA